MDMITSIRPARKSQRDTATDVPCTAGRALFNSAQLNTLTLLSAASHNSACIISSMLLDFARSIRVLRVVSVANRYVSLEWVRKCNALKPCPHWQSPKTRLNTLLLLLLVTLAFGHSGTRHQVYTTYRGQGPEPTSTLYIVHYWPYYYTVLSVFPYKGYLSLSVTQIFSYSLIIIYTIT